MSKRMTKTLARSIAKRIVETAPKRDYEGDIQGIIQAAVSAGWNRHVQAVYDNHETRHLLCEMQIYLEFGSTITILGATRDDKCYYDIKLPESVVSQIKMLEDQADQENDRRRELERELRLTLSSCYTLKRARELLPQFAKYLQDSGEEESITSDQLPSRVPSLVNDLMQLGVPVGDAQPNQRTH